MHPELERLVQAAIADGVITEKERNVLHKKALSLNFDLDEFDVILDGRIHSQQALQKSHKRKVSAGNALVGLVCPSCGSKDLHKDVTAKGEEPKYRCNFCNTVSFKPLRELNTPPEHAKTLLPVDLANLRSLMASGSNVFLGPLPEAKMLANLSVTEQSELLKIGSVDLLIQMAEVTGYTAVLHILSKKPDSKIQLAVARNRASGETTLQFLSTNAAIREEILRKHELSAETLMVFINSYNFKTDHRIGSQPQLTPEMAKVVVRKSNSDCPSILKPVYGKKLKLSLARNPHMNLHATEEYVTLDGSTYEDPSEIQPVPKSCFPPGVKISTKEGVKPIEKIRIGDNILSVDHDGLLTYAKVTRISRFDESPVLKIHFHGTGKGTLLTTQHHTIKSGQRWVKAGELVAGDPVFQYDSERHQLTEAVVRHVDTVAMFPVYNLHVDGTCTFFADDLLCHSFTEFRIIRTVFSRIRETIRDLMNPRTELNPSQI